MIVPTNFLLSDAATTAIAGQEYLSATSIVAAEAPLVPKVGRRLHEPHHRCGKSKKREPDDEQ
jgi:hypothetical protein